MTKVCSDCGIEKPIADYRAYKLKDGSSRTPRNCKTCAGRATKARQKQGKTLYKKPFEKNGELVRECSKCGEIKPLLEFHKHSTKIGYDSRCKNCKKIYDAQRVLPKRNGKSKRKVEKAKTLKICEQCGDKFEANPTYRKFCSNKCSGLAKRNRITKTCRTCKTTFQVAEWELAKKYCSRQCKNAYGKIFRDCVVCKNQFLVRKERIETHKTCSRECFNIIKKTSPTIPCFHCKKEIKQHKTRCGYKKFCSKKCSGLFKTTSFNKDCLECGKSFRVKLVHAEIKFCSSKCYGLNKTNHLPVSCIACGKTFSLPASQARKFKHCSLNCRKSKEKLFENKSSGTFTTEQWLEKIKYYGNRCYLCRVDLTNEIIHKEHRIPFSRGGLNFISNIAPACSKCNLTKNSKTEKEFREWMAQKNL